MTEIRYGTMECEVLNKMYLIFNIKGLDTFTNFMIPFEHL